MKYLLFFAVLFISCESFAQETETRKVSSFNKLEASGSSDVIIEKGDENLITIKYRGIDPKKIITEVKNEVLKVYLEKGNYQNTSVTVYITYKNLEAISNSGSGNLRCISDLAAPEFRISNSGSGNFECQGNIKAEQLSCSLSGSGNAKIASIETGSLELSMSGSGDFDIAKGTASRLSLQKSGSGDFEAFGVKSDVCTLSMSGSGDVEISANKTIEARMSGSGNITYKGDAVVNKIRSSGSGEIKRI